ncbi:MAG: Jag N-terminal domain-containing protein [Deferribacteraceae bacterium]|jgi:spoIIIJ-associated protein|nr:Jag N-terminal domain-containing protein [Deferribacteraceae bacterium]
MRYFEVDGDSPDEILKQFLIQQQAPEEFVEMEVIYPGSKGIMGIGRKPAKVKIIFNDHEYLKRKAKLYISEILNKAGFENYHIEMKDVYPDCVMNILSDDSNMLIGKSALTLDSFQYLLDRALKSGDESEMRILVDVDNYRERIILPLKEKAVRLAHSVKKNGRPVKMPPMASIVRREIHIAARTVQGISTISYGEGQIKSVTIMPEKTNKQHSRAPRRYGSNNKKPDNRNFNK